MTETTPARSVTERGFTIYDQFTDTYGSQIRVQESSAASGPRCWIFTTAADDDDDTVTAAAHLDVTQAERVRDALDSFIREAKETAQAESLVAAALPSETTREHQ